MPNPKRFLIFVSFVLAGTVVAVFAGGVGAGASASPLSVAASPLGVSASCATAPLPPQGAEVNTTLDVENRVLRYSFLNPASAQDVTVTISYEEPACAVPPELRQLIAHTLGNEAKVRADTCASVREVLESGAANVRGRPIDRRAAERLLTTEC